MNFNYLECFVVLAETLNFTTTGKILKVAQPSISRQIRLLEEILNVQLFIRDKHKVYLTTEGETLKAKLTPLLKEIRLIMDQTRSKTENIEGTIAFGCLPEVGQSSIMNRLLKFKKLYPGIILDIQYLDEPEIMEKCKCGKLDFGLILSQLNQENIRAYPVIKERSVLVTRNENNKKLERITDAQFVVYKSGDPLLLEFLKKYYKRTTHGKINIQISVNSHQSMIEALLSNDYYTFIPYLSVEKYIKQGKLKIASKNELRSDLYLIYLENNLIEHRKKLFQNFIMQELKKI